MRNEQDEHTALRLVWLAFAGWWLSALWVIMAWLAILLAVTLPAGFWMIARLPFVVSLKPAGDEFRGVVEDTLSRIQHSRLTQRPFVPRLLYCIIVGWWFSLGWAIVAWANCLSAHQQPKHLMMFMRLPAMMTLRRY
jgi:uncharacterized membrane protein YccF (DUF307 family)